MTNEQRKQLEEMASQYAKSTGWVPKLVTDKDYIEDPFMAGAQAANKLGHWDVIEMLDDIDSLESMLRMKQDDWIEACKEIDSLQSLVRRQAELLERCKSYLSGTVLTSGQHVKQLDGSVKWERVPTVAGDLLKDLEALGEE